MANNPQVYGIVDPLAGGSGPGTTPPLASVLAAGNTTGGITILGQGDGGSAVMAGAAGVASPGGSAEVRGGAGPQAGGDVYCWAGDSYDTDGYGGGAYCHGGDGETGGGAVVQGGAGSVHNGGPANLAGGSGIAGGIAVVSGGYGVSGAGGPVIIQAGGSGGGSPGDVTLRRVEGAGTSKSYLLVGGHVSTTPFGLIVGLYVPGPDNVTYGGAINPTTDMLVTHLDTYIFGTPSGDVTLAIYDEAWTLLDAVTIGAALGRISGHLSSQVKLRAGQLYQMGLYASAGSTSQFGYGPESLFVGDVNINWFKGPGFFAGGSTPSTSFGSAAYFMGAGSFAL